MDLLQLLSTGMALFVSMSIECITGFGGAVLAMPVLTMFLDVDSAVALMAMISGVNGARIYLQNRGKTDRAILRTVLLFGGCGLPVGMLLGGILPERTLKIILGGFVVAVSLNMLLRPGDPEKADEPSALRRVLERLSLFAGGIFHGAFSCGGPLIVIYAGRRQRDKALLRNTLTLVWFLFSAAILVKDLAVGGILTRPLLVQFACALPFCIAGAFMGGWLHKRVSVTFFAALTRFLLLLSGAMTLITTLLK